MATPRHSPNQPLSLVTEIRAQAAFGRSLRSLAAKYGVSQETIRQMQLPTCYLPELRQPESGCRYVHPWYGRRLRYAPRPGLTGRRYLDVVALQRVDAGPALAIGGDAIGRGQSCRQRRDVGYSVPNRRLANVRVVVLA